MADFVRSRRHFLFSASLTGSGLAMLGFPKEEKEENISPTEDLMREHGVLRRILLIYREAIRRIDASQDFPPDVLTNSANLIRRFVEDYHEKLEEEQIFPRFRKANTQVDLVNTLYQQHQKGRILTQSVLTLSPSMKDPGQKTKIRASLQFFIRMYEPHAAREDTVLFPAFRDIVPERELKTLGEQFEKKEDALFGEKGFEKNVDEVARLEKTLGIYDLAQFTPPV